MNVVKFKPEDYVKSSCSTEFYKAVGLFNIIKVGAVTDYYISDDKKNVIVQTENTIFKFEKVEEE